MSNPTPSASSMCFSLPTEKYGFPSEICVEIDQEHNTVTVYLVVLGVTITIGVLSATNDSITMDLGPVVSGIGGTVTALLHTESMCLSICFNLHYSSGKTSLAQFLVVCSIFSTHPQFAFYPNTQVEVLSDISPICGQEDQTSNDFFMKQPDTFIVETEEGVTFKLYQRGYVGNDTLVGTYQNGGAIDKAPYPIHFAIGNYYIGNVTGAEKAITVVFKRISS